MILHKTKSRNLFHTHKFSYIFIREQLCSDRYGALHYIACLCIVYDFDHTLYFFTFDPVAPYSVTKIYGCNIELHQLSKYDQISFNKVVYKCMLTIPLAMDMRHNYNLIL
jgi:hypothetical protein